MNMDDSRLQRVSAVPASLFTALQFERTVRRAESESSAEYLIVNDLRRLVPLDSAALWRDGDWRGGRMAAISGVEHFDASDEDVAGRVALAKHCAVANSTCSVLDSGFHPIIPADTSVLWCPLHVPSGPVGSLLLWRREQWRKEEIELLMLTSEGLAHALWAWRRNVSPHKVIRTRWQAMSRKDKKIACLLTLIFLLFPVRQSALAPAEIVAVKPVVVAAPMDGIVSAVHVVPNSPVKQGEMLFSLDDTALRSRKAVAEKGLAVAEADLQRASAKAFSDDPSKGEMVVLRGRVEERAAELGYLDEQLKRAVVTAPQAGVAVYGDPNEWLGKPVTTGERIMLVADPGNVEIKAYLPVSDAISLEPGSPVSMFLNASPLFSFDGVITSASYEAYPTNHGSLSYFVKASIKPGVELPRIGLQGSAKVYGSRVALVYYLFRRPLSAFRRFLGI